MSTPLPTGDPAAHQTARDEANCISTHTEEAATMEHTPRPQRPAQTPPKPRRALALSASRAGDFRQCPLLYRLRAIDRLPEPQTRAQFVGTVVHEVLEHLYQIEQDKRTVDTAVGLVADTFQRLRAKDPEKLTLVPEGEVEQFLVDCETLVRRLYEVENPRAFSPDSCEEYFATTTELGTPLRGFVDRIDLAPSGEVRVVDYKTGRKPPPRFEASALFQMKFYALMYYRIKGVIPRQLKLIYLKEGEPIIYEPNEAALRSTEADVDALWATIVAAGTQGDFAPKTSKLCGWCHHKPVCPAYGGTPPPYPGWPR